MSSQLSKRADLPALPPVWRLSSPATEQSDRVAGQEAAARGDPAGAAVEAYASKLVTAASRDLIALGNECEKLQADQSARRERLQKELDDEVTERAAANDREHAEVAGRLRRELGPDSAGFKDAAARAEDAGKALREVRAKVGGRPLRTAFGPWYIVLMLALALAEVPVNRAAFELTFREEPVFSLLLAGAVGTVLIFFAHLIGVILRQWPEQPKASGVAARAFALALLLGLVGSGVYFLARMRQAYMQLTAAESAGFGNRLQEALRGNLPPGGGAVLPDLPFTTGDMMFIAVNVLLFVFGVAASFLRHDPHPDYETAVVQSRRADRRLARIEAKYEGKLADENQRFETSKRGLDTQMAELGAAIASVRDHSERVAAHLANARALVAQTVRGRCGTFAAGYNAAAGNGRDHASVPPLAAIERDLPLGPLARAA